MFRTSLAKDMNITKSQFAHYNLDSLEGLNSGVPTRTTATLTPTTLRSVEQTFLEIPSQVEAHQNQARFVPPVIHPSHQVVQKPGFMSVVDTKSWQGGSARVTDGHPVPQVEFNSKPVSVQPRRNVGGRRPIKDKSISPEEEERRAVRRERNKLAAARCRKRRLDHTNELMLETDGLQKKKSGLQNEIQQLKLQKEELEYLLESHRPCCRLEPENEILRSESPPDIKPFTLGIKIGCKDEPETEQQAPCIVEPPKRSGGKRPTSLPVPHPPTVLLSDGVPITTPTAGILFNFDSLMDGGTGLTPVSGPLAPSCSTQQRHSGVGTVSDLSSPDSSNKLVSL